MPIMLILVLTLHQLAAFVWAGLSFAAWRRVDVGRDPFLAPQAFAGLIALGSGAHLWLTLHNGGSGPIEKVLGVGAALGVIALLLQLIARRWRKKANLVATILLVAALLLMFVARETMR